MKEVTLRLSALIEDEKSGSIYVRLDGALLVGTPLQVGIIYEALQSLPGDVDIVTTRENTETVKTCQSTLKQVRENQPNSPTGEYNDPDK